MKSALAAAGLALLVGCSSSSSSSTGNGGNSNGGSPASGGSAGTSSGGASSGGTSGSGGSSGSAGTSSGGTSGSGGSTGTSCANPVFTTSDPNGGWSDGGYYVHNNMWNVSGYQVSETLYACAYNNWYVVATMDNSKGDGAVKTYPNVHKDFNEPQVSSFNAITSSFAETSPHVGIYEDAYDIWLNGVASSGSTEIMIWTDNEKQVPSGSQQGTATFGGRAYTVWKSGSYIAFVAKQNFTSGTLDLLAIFNWVMQKGWMPQSSTLGQICYGAELVSTGGKPATFTFTGFSVTAN